MKPMAVLFLACLISAAAIAEEAPKPAANETALVPLPKDRARERLDQVTRGEVVPPVAKGDPMAPEAVDALALSDPQTRAMYLAAHREYFSYRIDGMKHRRGVFAWQLLSAKFIFGTVLLLVLAGMYFAAVQFHSGLKTKTADTPTELVANMQGIKVTSPVLGVIILIISLAFFYCYLVFVYPIVDKF